MEELKHAVGLLPLMESYVGFMSWLHESHHWRDEGRVRTDV